METRRDGLDYLQRRAREAIAGLADGQDQSKAEQLRQVAMSYLERCYELANASHCRVCNAGAAKCLCQGN